jgi:hypothetical protein
MKFVRWVGYLLIVALFLWFARETLRFFTNEDLWFAHYLW